MTISFSIDSSPGATAPNDSPILVVQGIRVVYNDSIQAISRVSLSVPRGTITALLGANGSGKTTTLRAISHLLIALRGRVASGSILFDGHDIASLRSSLLVRRGLAQVLEGRHCFSQLSVEENLQTGAIARGSSPRETREDLQRIYAIFPRLREKRLSLAGLTSGGEQQMLAIGRALMTRPRLLILDEPSMGLAPIVVRDIFEVLRTLNARDGLSILIAEQNSTLTLRYADHIVVLENGRDVLSGAAQDIRANHNLEKFYLGEAALTLPDPDTALDPGMEIERFRQH